MLIKLKTFLNFFIYNSTLMNYIEELIFITFKNIKNIILKKIEK